jgi:hypothetical protein
VQDRVQAGANLVPVWCSVLANLTAAVQNLHMPPTDAAKPMPGISTRHLQGFHTAWASEAEILLLTVKIYMPKNVSG